MASDALFSVLGNAVIVGWLGLLIVVFVGTENGVGRAAYAVSGLAIPAALSTLPILRLAFGNHEARGDLFSLSGIEARFSDPNALFLLYFEALAFSLFVGGLIVRDREARRVPRVLTIPPLLVMFFKGPIGALIYGALRSIVVLHRK